MTSLLISLTFCPALLIPPSFTFSPFQPSLRSLILETWGELSLLYSVFPEYHVHYLGHGTHGAHCTEICLHVCLSIIQWIRVINIEKFSINHNTDCINRVKSWLLICIFKYKLSTTSLRVLTSPNLRGFGFDL